MSETFELTRVVQVGTESTEGTRVPATRQLQTWKVAPSIKATADDFTPSGYQAPTVSIISKDWTESKYSGKPTYGELVYGLSYMFGPATITTPNTGVLSRQWQWNWYGNVLDAPVPFTQENGDSGQCDVTPGDVMTQFGLTFDRGKVDQAATALGRQTDMAGSLTAIAGTNAVQTVTITGGPAGGTFTLAFRGQVSGGIAYNATAAALQAALEALTTIGTGNVAATGSAGGPYTVTFQGTLQKQPVPLLVKNSTGLTGGTSPDVTVANQTTGVSITPEVTLVPLAGKDVDVYLDTNPQQLGSTQLLRNFDGHVDWSGKYNPAWPLNSANLSYAFRTPAAPKTMADFTLATDTAGQSVLGYLRNNTRYFMRIKWTGPVIEGSIHYSVILDLAVNAKTVGDEKVVDNGVHCRGFSGVLEHDNGWGRAAQITVVNQLTAL